MKTNKVFNIIITGVGGQGLITLLQILAQSAIDAGLDVKTSESHGLSQRGGSVNAHIRFGKRVYSPIVPRQKCDVVIAMETQEVLNAADYANQETYFLVDTHQTPTLAKSVSGNYIKNSLSEISSKAIFLPAYDITRKKLGTSVVAGMFLLAYAVVNRIIPFTKKDIEKAIQEVMPEKYWDINAKAISLAEDYNKNLNDKK